MNTTITIDVNKNKAGNLIAMTDALYPDHPDLDCTDTVAGIALKDSIPGVSTEDVSMAPPGSSEFTQTMLRRLVLTGAKGKQLLIDYNTQDGNYEISINDFGVTEIATMQIVVNRQNLNRRPIYHPAMAA